MSSASTNIKPKEIKREEFRKYLEHAGVMDLLTNIILSLYEKHEKPDDALDYIRKQFGADDSDKLDGQVECLKKDLAEARSEIAELKARLSKYESEDTA